MYPYILYPIFWVCQGTMYWALFVIGHDCGHGSFSKGTRLNYLIGHLSHVPLLVPFHSWRISHHKHHTNTSNVRKDESFIAVSERHYKKMFSFVKMVRYHTYWFFGWTLYLIFGMPLTYYSHFLPNSSIFSKEEKPLVIESLIWIIGFLSILMKIYVQFGWMFLVKYYFVPYGLFSSWISIVTLLHHTHPDVPWYRNEEWNFLRGSLSTVDRNYGIIEEIHHNIGTHIVHHLFMKIPHYHLKEATEAIKPILGSYYKRSHEPMLKALWRIWKECRFVDNEKSILFYNGIDTTGSQ